MRHSILRTTTLIGLLSLSACGPSNPKDPPTPPTPITYTVAGTVSGLTGSGLVLQNNGANNQTVAASGSVTFATSVNSGTAYAVTVLTQPSSPTQTCAVANGSGSVASANVTNITVTCTTNSYVVGGTITGLTGTGLVLQNNNSNNLNVTANGGFAFSTSVMSGGNYSVTVSTQPSGQTCTVTSGSGTVTNAAIANVSIACRAQVGKFLYVPNMGSNNVSTYSINANTGALTAIGTLVSTDQAPSSIVVDQAEKFLYLTNLGSASAPPKISAYAINSTTGALTQNANSPFPLSIATPPAMVAPTNGGVIMTIHPSGKFAHISNRIDSKLYGATLNPTTGDLSEIAGMPIALGATNDHFGIGFWGVYDPTGKFFYMSHNVMVGGTTITGYVSAFQVNATTGALTLIGSAVPTGGSYAVLVELDPSGKFLIAASIDGVGGVGNGNVAVFAINSTSGALTAVTGSPFAVPGRPGYLFFHPTKNFAYVSLIPVSTSANRSFAVFQMDSTTGQLSSTGAPVQTTGADPGTSWIDPTGKFIVVCNTGSNNIQSFSINQTNGALTEVAGSPLTTDQKPSIVPDPSWNFFYGTHAGSNTISTYTFDNAGKLTLANTLPTGTNPGWPTLVGKQ